VQALRSAATTEQAHRHREAIGVPFLAIELHKLLLSISAVGPESEPLTCLMQQAPGQRSPHLVFPIPREPDLTASGQRAANAYAIDIEAKTLKYPKLRCTCRMHSLAVQEFGDEQYIEPVGDPKPHFIIFTISQALIEQSNGLEHTRPVQS
jgi:hypothetical protein